MAANNSAPRHSRHSLLPACGTALLVLTGLLYGCPARTDHKPAETVTQVNSGQPRYVVTVVPLKLILEPLVRGRAGVEVLLPAGASAHTYEPRPSDAQAAAQADALLWIGEAFDGFAAGLETRASIELLPLLPENARLQGFSHQHADAKTEHENEPDEHHAAEEDGVDPHFFTDPLAVKALLPALTAELARLDPAGQAQYAANAAAFSAELDALHSAATSLLAPVKGQATLLFHPSFGYLFQRYGIELAGVIEEFPGKEPSPKYLQQLTQTIQARHIRAIFTETLLPNQPAQVLAEATGTPVFELDPSCGASSTGYASYREWLLYNARILREALANEPGA